jgi:hypothetical protein
MRLGPQKINKKLWHVITRHGGRLIQYICNHSLKKLLLQTITAHASPDNYIGLVGTAKKI